MKRTKAALAGIILLIVIGIAVVGNMIVQQDRSPNLSGWKVGQTTSFSTR